MIQVNDLVTSVLTRSYKVQVRVSSYFDDQVIADDIPVIATSIQEEGDRSLRVPERLVFTVPRFVDGFDWAPVTDAHPLAANGQKLRVELGVETAFGIVEWFPRGWFVIYASDPRDTTVEVEAQGLLTLIDEARFIAPFQPSGNLSNTVRSLVEPALNVSIDSALSDRAVPAGINYTDDRLDALKAVLDAWPAEYNVTEDGYLSVYVPVESPSSVLELTNGQGGTVITALGESTREGAFNLVVATGTDSDGNEVRGFAYDFNGPKAFGGPFNPLPVPFGYSSPLLTTNLQAAAAARTRLANIKRETTKAFTVTMIANPLLQLGDVVSLTNEHFSNLQCSVEKLSLPYVPVDGAWEVITVRSLT